MKTRNIVLLPLLLVCILAISAAFGIACEPETYQLYAVVIYGQGVVSPADGEFSEGELVTLVAIPESGWEFDHWANQASGTQNPITITMDEEKWIHAYFVQEVAPTPTPSPTSTSSAKHCTDSRYPLYCRNAGVCCSRAYPWHVTYPDGAGFCQNIPGGELCMEEY